MEENSGISFEIQSKENENVTIIVKFANSSDTLNALDKLDSIRVLQKMRKQIQRIREICAVSDDILYYPKKEIELPKSRWLAVAAAASYSTGIPINVVIEKGGINKKSIRAYCTSANNPTSEYLTIKDDKVFINPEGVNWLLELLIKEEKLLKIQ